MTNDSIGYGFSTQDQKKNTKTQIPLLALKKTVEDERGRYPPDLIILPKADQNTTTGAENPHKSMV